MPSYRTFKEWSALGFKIKRGSKAHWIDAVAVFAADQVEKTKKFDYGNHWIGCAPKGTGDYYDGDQDMYDVGDYY